MECVNTCDYHGGTRRDYIYNGRLLIIVEPAVRRAEPCPWVWRAEFFDAFPAVDLARLQRGYAIVYYALSDMYGCPEAVKLMKQAHDFVTERFSLRDKANIFGFSRGGLYACNYALAYPEDVQLLYLDAPVLDIRSWPLCLLPATAAKKADFTVEAAQCAELYGLTSEQEALGFHASPIDSADRLKKLPVLLIAGDADTTVPFCDNGALLARVLEGGDFLLILKPGCEHWPHSLQDPAPAVEFLEAHNL